jgi:hypothetical protein
MCGRFLSTPARLLAVRAIQRRSLAHCCRLRAQPAAAEGYVPSRCSHTSPSNSEQARNSLACSQCRLTYFLHIAPHLAHPPATQPHSLTTPSTTAQTQQNTPKLTCLPRVNYARVFPLPPCRRGFLSRSHCHVGSESSAPPVTRHAQAAASGCCRGICHGHDHLSRSYLKTFVTFCI